MIGGERLVGRLDRSQLESYALGIGEARPKTVEFGVDALVGEPVPQNASASSDATRKETLCTIPGPGPPAREARVLEEGDVGAGAALLVRVEEVIDGRVVLVDRLLHQPEAEHAGIEVHVLPARPR